MNKYLAIYQTGVWFFKTIVGMEIIEAESWEKAYQQLSPRFQIKVMRQVNWDSNALDFDLKGFE